MSRSSFIGMMSHSEKSDALVFFVNGRKVIEKNADPEVNLLFYLRKKLHLPGTKYGCGGGGCGACTVMISRYDCSTKKIRHYSVTACLVPVCILYGAAVTTVEGIGSTKTRIHPVQERIAKGHGTQCGFCTPGMVMSIYTLLRNHLQPSTEQLIETLGGNLCRCTGYRPIVESGKSFSTESSCCQMKGTGKCCLDQEENEPENKNDVCTKLYQEEEFLPLDPTQELIFPPELMRMAEETRKKTLVFQGPRVTWISPATLNDLLELKLQYPQAPLVMGNTFVGPNMKFKDVFHPVTIFPTRISELNVVMLDANQGMFPLKLRAWNEEMLDEACRLVLDEVTIPGSSSGRMVEYKRTLMISFLFKFYLEVLQELNVRDPRYPHVPNKVQSVLEDFPLTIPCGTQAYECVDSHQLPQDPVGRPVMHQSGIKHATGEAVFSDDMPAIDEELSLAVVTSTRPHANIIFHCWIVLQVICVGQIVCAVAADSYFHAKQAAKKVKVVYEDMEPVIVTIKDAVNHKSFIGSEKKLEQGNIKEAFQTVDQIIEDWEAMWYSGKGSRFGVRIREVHVGGQEHFYMETQSVLVIPKTEDKEMEIYVSSQDAALVQEKVASSLGVPRNRIMCHMRQAGGGFGGKMTKPALLGAVAAVAANKTGHPICFILEHGDDMLITGGCHPLLGKYKIGFMNDGKIQAADIEYYTNGGCTPDESEMVIEYALLKLENAYKIPNLQIQGRACKTNLPSNTAFRGFGFPQGTFVTECWITAVAAKCNLPAEKVRELNMYKTIDRTIHKQQFDPKNLIRCWDGCMEKSSYYSRKKAIELFNQQNYWKKRGIAIIPMKFSVGYPKTYYHQIACQTLMKCLEPIISKNPNGIWQEWANDAFGQSISLSATGYFRGYKAGMDWVKGEGDVYPYFVYGTACSEVEVDCLTGAHKNIRTDIVMDACFSINPAIDIGQIEGAFTQGVGLYTLEELKYSPEGVLYTRSPNEYKIPSVTDIPEELNVSLLTSTKNPIAIYSSKGLGESGMFLGSSVYFAILDAVAAARKERGLTETFTMNSPATPELIRMMCVDKFTSLIPRDDPKSYKPWSIPVA
ncbi:aldehyde oxidase 3-like [Notamacropus eugenii]|uniref:aldehyde oxidase 3-like n=1 Tax=Notamacropus eugenii TaxID=9315 RepID=UPI003B6803FF